MKVYSLKHEESQMALVDIRLDTLMEEIKGSGEHEDRYTIEVQEMSSDEWNEL